MWLFRWQSSMPCWNYYQWQHHDYQPSLLYMGATRWTPYDIDCLTIYWGKSCLSLLFVHQSFIDNDMFFEFYGNYFLIKYCISKTIVFSHSVKGGLYLLHASSYLPVLLPFMLLVCHLNPGTIDLSILTLICYII